MNISKGCSRICSKNLEHLASPPHPSPSYTALGAVGCSLSPGHHQYIPCLFYSCFGKPTTKCAPHIFQSVEDKEDVFPMHPVTGRLLSAQSLPIIALISESLTRLVPWLAVRLPSRPPSGGLSEFSRFCGFVTNTSKAGARSLPYPSPVSCSGRNPTSVFQSCSGKQAEPDPEPRLAVRRGGSWGLIGSGGLAGRCLRST